AAGARCRTGTRTDQEPTAGSVRPRHGASRRRVQQSLSPHHLRRTELRGDRRPPGGDGRRNQGAGAALPGKGGRGVQVCNLGAGRPSIRTGRSVSCSSEARELVTFWVAGSLGPEEAETVSRHVAGCA